MPLPVWTRIHNARWNRRAESLRDHHVQPPRVYGAKARHTAWMNDRLARELLHHLQIGPTDHVLEVGCSEGYFARRFAAVAASVMGVDAAPRMVAVAARKSQTLANLRFAHASVCALPFPDRTFSRINCFSVLQYVSTPAQVQLAYREMARVLQPGGLLYVGDICHNRKAFLYRVYRDNCRIGRGRAALTYLWHWALFTCAPPMGVASPAELRALADAAGLETIRITPTVDRHYHHTGIDAIHRKPLP